VIHLQCLEWGLNRPGFLRRFDKWSTTVCVKMHGWQLFVSPLLFRWAGYSFKTRIQELFATEDTLLAQVWICSAFAVYGKRQTLRSRRTR
jgi:hypothetical protein